jgi:hypothetical protein
LVWVGFIKVNQTEWPWCWTPVVFFCISCFQVHSIYVKLGCGWFWWNTGPVIRKNDTSGRGFVCEDTNHVNFYFRVVNNNILKS